MNIQEAWERALKKTELIRMRMKSLSATESTQLPYIFLAESSVNEGDCVVRKGAVLVEKPAILLPDQMPSFEGFEFEKDFPLGEQFLTNFFLVRGIRFPTMKYNNRTDELDVYEGRLQQAIDHYKEELQRKEDLTTGLVVGPEDCWQLSAIIFICSQIARQTEGDVRKLLDGYRNK